MKRLLPAPVLSAGLFVLWLLLMQSLSAGTLALGLVLAVFWPAVTAPTRPFSARVGRPLVCAQLFARVVGDMFRSNVAVAAAILGRRSGDLRSGFVRIPLELRDPHALAALAMIVTFTPGTAWAQLAADSRTLLLHVLDLDDAEALVASIKARYERPLLEIFS